MSVKLNKNYDLLNILFSEPQMSNWKKIYINCYLFELKKYSCIHL